MSSTPAQYVYVVGGDCLVSQWPTHLLRRHNISVRRFATPHDCLQALRDGPCVLLVISLDGDPESGLHLLKSSNRLHPQTHRVALIGKGDVPLAMRAMRAGAQECIEKPLDEDWWLSAIQIVSSKWGNTYPHGNVALTEIERFVLGQVVAGRTSREIAAVLHRSPRTVEVHRTHIMHKLGVSSTVDLVRQGVRMELSDSTPQPEPDTHSESETSGDSDA